MSGLLTVNERIPFDVDWQTKASLRFRKDPLKNMVYTTVEMLAEKARKTVPVFLNAKGNEVGLKIAEIAKAIDNHGHNEKDIIPIIQLFAENAQELIRICNTDKKKGGNNLSFEELLSLKKNFPDKSLALLMTYALAKRDPKLANIAGNLLTEESSAEAADPNVRFHPAKSQISYLNVRDIKNSGLDAGEIFAQTNEADKAALEYRTEQTRAAREEAERQQKKYLANKEIELALNPTVINNDDYKKQLVKKTLEVRT